MSEAQGVFADLSGFQTGGPDPTKIVSLVPSLHHDVIKRELAWLRLLASLPGLERAKGADSITGFTIRGGRLSAEEFRALTANRLNELDALLFRPLGIDAVGLKPVDVVLAPGALPMQVLVSLPFRAGDDHLRYLGAMLPNYGEIVGLVRGVEFALPKLYFREEVISLRLHGDCKEGSNNWNLLEEAVMELLAFRL
jgi:hypothetical protein